ncbi:hypothetical protein [Magnetospirillum sp. 15-1]|uniref:hypothetical protein n=1 Tax=Magnetospirillum sp. 15-1 TaxID=1979370 RepID=UPI001141CA7F|nr:hypothetical protein [Magnetospirillum sp. 15-1]
MIEKHYGHLEPLHRKDELKRVHRDAAPDTNAGLMDGIRQIEDGPITVQTRQTFGAAHEADICIGNIVTMVQPDGEMLQLIRHEAE